MSRDEYVEVVCYLNPHISRTYLEGLSGDQLEAYCVHLRAVRVMRINDFAQLSARTTRDDGQRTRAVRKETVRATALSPR